MTRDLSFLTTMSIEEFKEKEQVSKIEIKQNPETGKCFFVYGFQTGACSKKFLSNEVTEPVISEVCSAETGDIFYMLHQRSENGVVTIGTL